MTGTRSPKHPPVSVAAPDRGPVFFYSTGVPDLVARCSTRSSRSNCRRTPAGGPADVLAGHERELQLLLSGQPRRLRGSRPPSSAPIGSPPLLAAAVELSPAGPARQHRRRASSVLRPPPHRPDQPKAVLGLIDARRGAIASRPGSTGRRPGHATRAAAGGVRSAPVGWPRGGPRFRHRGHRPHRRARKSPPN